MAHKTIKIEIEIVEDDDNVGCVLYKGDKLIHFNELTEEEKHKVVESLAGFAKLFSR